MTVDLAQPRVPRSVPDWHELGACKLFPELDRPEVLDPDKVVRIAPGIVQHRVITPAFNAWQDSKPGTPERLAAVLICSVCPVRLECARGALERREKHGIWGGLDYADRKTVAAEFGYEPPGDPPEHGTNSRRVKWGCTCPDCRRAHALYEAERRANARRAAIRRSVWSSPLLVLARPVTIGRRRQCAGQYLLPLALPAPKHAQPEPAALPVAA